MTGKDYQAFLGDKSYEKHVIDLFDSFLHKVFHKFNFTDNASSSYHNLATQEIRDEQRLDLGEDPDADSENDNGYNSPCEDKQGEDESDESCDLEGDSLEMDEDATNVAGQGNKLKAQKKCDYELKRDVNI